MVTPMIAVVQSSVSSALMDILSRWYVPLAGMAMSMNKPQDSEHTTHTILHNRLLTGS